MVGRITLIERDPALRDALAFSLGLEGFEVRSAGTLDKDDLADGAHSADCLIFAHDLGGAGALEACATIAHLKGGLLTIVLATNPTRSLRERLESIGAHLVEKPLLGSALTDLLHSMFPLRRAS